VKTRQPILSVLLLAIFLFVVGCFPDGQPMVGDLDTDGIPDELEMPGETYLGMPLYEWGARPNQTDLFVEIDYMDSTDNGNQAMDYGLVPSQAALQKVVDAFALQGIALHFDVGALYAGSAASEGSENDAVNPAMFNLGGGEMVPYSQSVGLGLTQAAANARTDYSANYMAEERRGLFYYMLFGSSQNSDGSPGSGGVGEIANRISLITLGGWGLNDETVMDRNLRVNTQASTIMHEFGHNLGLRHGGFENLNFKPNYTSVMNYLYALEGLPSENGEDDGDRYYLLIQSSQSDVYAPDCQGNHPYWPDTLSNSPFDEAFIVDFSHGLNATIDEGAIDESVGIGADNGIEVDFDCDAWVETLVNFDVNRDNNISQLSDHDDWGALYYYFHYTHETSSLDQLLTSIEISEERGAPAWVLARSHQ